MLFVEELNICLKFAIVGSVKRKDLVKVWESVEMVILVVVGDVIEIF